MVCGSSLPSSTIKKKKNSELDPPLTKLSGSAHEDPNKFFVQNLVLTLNAGKSSCFFFDV